MIECKGITARDIPMSTRVRFIAKFDYQPFSCWEFQGSKTEQGYGRFFVPGRRALPAHRVAYAMFYGRLDDGLTVDHLCGNPSCVNPDHLEAVTHGENLRRARKGACAVHAAKTHCPKGHEYSSYTHPKSGRTQRVCWTCKRDQGRDWQRRKRGTKPSGYRV